jgi:hypothetical protein
MPKPPKTPPHSDLDGVHEDERPNIETANAAGQGAADLERARADSPGKPVPGADRGGRDDRSR